jgi:iron complex outermembrane receptor protein
MHTIPLGGFFAAIFLAQTAGAQGTSAPRSAPANSLDQVIVTATRLTHSLRDVPAAVSVITEEDIQLARQQITLAESIASVPGLFMQDRYNFAQGLRVAIRGFGARANFGVRGIKILIDGIPETLPDGQASADTIDLGATSRIEVIRGPSSALYGNASGGVILVTTESPPATPFVSAQLSGGDYGLQRYQLKAGGQGARVGYLLNVSNWKYDGYREHSAAEKTDVTGRFNIDFDNDRKLLLTLAYGKQPLSLDPGGVTAAMAADEPRAARPANITFNARQDYEQTRLGLVYDTPLGTHTTLTARNYYVWRDFMQFLPYQANGIPSFDRFYAGAGVSVNHDGQLFDRPNRFIVGVDFDRQSDDVSRHDNDFGVIGQLSERQDEKVTSRGVYAQNEWSIAPNLQLTLGARFDDVKFAVSDHFLSDGDDSGTVRNSSTSPMAALVYELSPAVNFYARYSTSFEVPTTSEYARPDGSGGFNQSLEPQRSTNHEVGMRGLLANRHQYELALYTTTTRDELIPYEVPGSPGHDYFANAGRSGRKGVEFSLRSQLSDRWHTTLSYTYSDFSFKQYINADGDDFRGNIIPGTAANQLYGEITWKDARGWFGSLDALYIGKQYANDANTATNDGYTLAGMRLGYRYASEVVEVTPYIAANNLLDVRYNANVRINAFGGRFFEAGAGREVFAGLTVKYLY